jgi:hypothetical protein
MRKRGYKVHYQLGGKGATMHRTVSGAVRALRSAQRSAARSGDCQGIYLQAYEMGEHGYYMESAMTDAEMSQIEGAQ